MQSFLLGLSFLIGSVFISIPTYAIDENNEIEAILQQIEQLVTEDETTTGSQIGTGTSIVNTIRDKGYNPLQIRSLSRNSADMDGLIELMHTYGVTIYKERTSFMVDRPVRRDEVAKMYVIARKEILGDTSTTKDQSQCLFNDANQGHSDLVDITSESCRMGLFQGSNGNFLPRRSISYAQAITVLVRMMHGLLVEPEGQHFAINYMQKALKLGLIDKDLHDDMTMRNNDIPRGEIIKMLAIVRLSKQ